MVWIGVKNLFVVGLLQSKLEQSCGIVNHSSGIVKHGCGMLGVVWLGTTKIVVVWLWES